MKKNLIEAKYCKTLPEGCPPFDVVRLRMANAFSDDFELYMTPDEAMLVANHLVGAAIEALYDNPAYDKQFITSREDYAKEKLNAKALENVKLLKFALKLKQGFATKVGGSDYCKAQILCKAGYLQDCGISPDDGVLQMFKITRKGAKLAKAQ